MGTVTLPQTTVGLTTGSASVAVQGTGASVPPGLESVIQYRQTYLNIRNWLDSYIVTEIGGTDDADLRDAREINPGQHGETPFDAYYGGRTITLSGKIRAHNLSKLRDMQQGLRQTFADLSTEYPLIFHHPDPNKSVMLYCKKHQPVTMRETQVGQRLEREFQVSLRASNPRFLALTQKFSQFTGFRSDSFGTPATVDKRNYVQNPSLEINGNQWNVAESGFGTGSVRTSNARITTDGSSGTCSWEIRARAGHTIGATPHIYMFPTNFSPANTVLAGGMPVVAGQVISCRIAAKTVTAMPTGADITLRVRWFDAAGNQTGSDTTVSGSGAVATITNPAANTWHQLYGTATAPAGAFYAAIRLNFNVTTGAAALTVPASPAVTTATTGGTLAAATYHYKVTALNARGETMGSTNVSVTTTGTTSANTVTWSAVTGATGYRVYRGTASGSYTQYYDPGNVTSFVDTGQAPTATRTAADTPASDTTGYEIQARADAALMSEATSTADMQTYFEGGTASGTAYNYRWQGVPHASVSERVTVTGLDSTLWNFSTTTKGASVMPNGVVRFGHNITYGAAYTAYGVNPPVDQRVTLKMTTPSDLAQPFYIAPIVKWSDWSNYLYFRVNNGTGATSIGRLYTAIAGTHANPVSTASFTMAASTNYWVRLQVVGNVVSAWVYAEDPALNPAATPLVTLAPYTLTGTAATLFGAGVAKAPGWRNSGAGSTIYANDAELDDWKVEQVGAEGYRILSLINDGNFSAQPQIQIVGPVTNPVLSFYDEANNNALIGKLMIGSSLVPVTIPDGTTYIIDIAKRTLVDHTGANKFTALNVQSDWPELVSGTTVIHMDGSSMGANTAVSVTHRDTWI